MASNPVGWFEIYVEDMPRARAFYESTLQTRLDRLPNVDIEMLAFPSDMATYGAAGALVRMDGMPPGGTGTLVYFSVEDCAVAADRAAGAGGRITSPKTSIGEYGHIALCFDTEGNMFGLHSMR